MLEKRTLKMNEKNSYIDLKHLNMIERNILLKMLDSKESFLKLDKKLNKDDFTFVVYKLIFEYFQNHLLSKNFFEILDKRNIIIEISQEIFDIYNIKVLSVFKILSGELNEKNYELDLIELLDFSKYRSEKNKDKEQGYMNIKVEDENGKYVAVYLNGIIYEIFTSFIFYLPNEITDTFVKTLENLNMYIQKENHDLTLTVNEENDQVQSLNLIKNIDKIKKVKKINDWFEKYDLKDFFELSELRIIDYDNKGIIEIPHELFEIKSNLIFVSFINNKIKKIPENISLLNLCTHFLFCNNKIEIIPESLYNLSSIKTLCFHNNKINQISENIGNLKMLEELSISNNEIKELPREISNLSNLSKLDIENTLIDENSLELINLEQIKRISFNDKLLPFFMKNIKRLKNINTINLTHSNYSKDDDIFRVLNLNFENEKWMEDEDYQGNGCIVFSD